MNRCLFCSKDIPNKHRPSSFYKFCNATCMGLARWTETKTHIRNNTKIFTEPRTYKKYLLEIFGNICSICKTTEWMGQPIGLIMDHIDGNSSNWNIDNLRHICPNCDMQLPTYKSKNKGNGRYFRKQRYLEGKSY